MATSLSNILWCDIVITLIRVTSLCYNVESYWYKRMRIDGRPIMVAMDTSVIVHQLHNQALIEFGDVGTLGVKDVERGRQTLSNWVKVQMGWVMSGLWLKPVTGDSAVTMVWAMDCKNKAYWRTEYLASDVVTSALPLPKRGKNKGIAPRPISYKGGRKRATRTFELIKEQVVEMLINSPFSILYRQCYEADDLIATITVVNDMLSQPYNIIVATVDNDLLGLVRDSVGWVCTEGWLPRVRLDLEGVNQWRHRRKLAEVGTPQELWTLKALKEGDASDKIPPCPTGETLPAIDLLNPPEVHRLWLKPEVYEQCERILSTFRKLDEDTGYRALEAMTIRGCQPVVKCLPEVGTIEE